MTKDEALADAIKIIEAYVPEDALGWANDGYDEHWPVKAEFLHHARTALSEPDAKEAECERLREAAKPFVEFFQSRVQHGSEARQDWNERMPDTFPGPENVPLTMGQWRALRAALEKP